MALSASGAQWLCGCGLCPTSKVLLQAAPEHLCCGKSETAAGWHEDGGCACSDHGQALGAAEVHQQPVPHAVATWTPLQTMAPAVVAATVDRTFRGPLPRAPPTGTTPVWLQTLNLLI